MIITTYSTRMKKSIIILCLTLGSSMLQAQKTITYTHTDKLFNDGCEMYDLQNYGVAFRYFGDYLQQFTSKDRNINYAEAEYYRACCAFELGQPDAGLMLDQYLADCPCSNHASKARLLRGITYFNHNKFVEAADSCFSRVNVKTLNRTDKDRYYFHYGYSELQLQEYDKALSLFKQVSDGSTTYKQSAQYYEAYICYLQKNYDEALPTFLALQNSEKYATTVPYYIAQIYYSKGMYDKVLEYGLNLVEKNPGNENNAEVFRLIGESYFQQKDYDNTIKYLGMYEQRVSRIYRNDAYMLGTAYYNKGNYTEAVSRLQKVTVISNDEMAQNAYLYLGSCYLKLNDKNNARLAFEAASKLDFDKNVKEEAYYNYALIVYDQSYSPFNESVTAFENFLTQFPNSRYNEQVYNYLVNVYLTTKNYQAAYESIERIKNPSASIKAARQRVVYCLGIQEYTISNTAEAINWFTKSLEDRQCDSETEALALFWRGESYYRQLNYDKATADFNNFVVAVGARKTDVFNLGHYNLGYCYFSQKNYTKALTWFRKYVNLEDKNKTLLADAYNRIGDCYYIARDFTNASKNYNQVHTLNGPGSDYAYFQQGYIQGLQKDYKGKITTLTKLVNEYKSSEYQAEALFEIGSAYMMLGDNKTAIEKYNEVSRSFFHSPLARKSRLHAGMLYDDMGEQDNAVKQFKTVVDLYPNSEESRTALESLKKIYVDRNDVSGYATYVNSLGGLATFSASEEDSLTYVAAENLYTKEKYKEAVSAFENYLAKFPNTANKTAAHFLLGNSYYRTDNKAKAKTEFAFVAGQTGSWQAVGALARLGEIQFEQKEYTEAAASYKKLESISQKAEQKLKAQQNIMECYNEMGDADSTIMAANKLVNGSNIDINVTRKAYYLRAKAYEKKDQVAEAQADYKKLSENCMDRYGAEAEYRVAQYLYHEGKKDDAEKEIFAFIEKNTPHQYWLAKAFILLADIYISENRDFEAKQYLVSLQDNYTGTNDNIATEIKARLDDIESRESKQVKN